ncbi:MAG: DUF2723 domain-containing protein [Candidatus Eisenbacteria bacterium]
MRDPAGDIGELGAAPLCSAALVSVTSFAVYCLTAARDLTLGDSAEFVAVARTLGVAHPPGYPLYTLLSALAVRVPAGTPFFRLSLLSALFAAVASGVLSLLVWELTAGRGIGLGGASGHEREGGPGGERRSLVPRVLGAVVAGLAFSFSPALWSQATVPEVYTLSALLVFGALLVFVRWRRMAEEGLVSAGLRGERLLWVGGLLLGLSLAHHLTAALAVPSVAVALAAGKGRHAPSRSVWRMLLFVLAGLSLYAYLPLRSAQDPAVLWTRLDSLPSFVGHVSGSQYTSRLFAEPLPGVLANLRSFFSGLPSALTWPVLSLAGVGVATLWIRSKRLFAVLALEAILVVVHAVNYRIPDIGNYYIPVYAVLAACAGLAVAELPRLVSRAGSRSRLAAAFGLAAVAGVSVFLHTAVLWPERDLSDATGGRVYLERMLSEVPPNAVVLAQNDRTVFPLWYSRFVDGTRDDIAVINIRERAPHLEKWYPGVEFPTEGELATLEGRDPSVPCVPPARASMPVSGYLPLLVELNGDVRPIVADIDIGRDAFPRRLSAPGLLVRISGASTDAASSTALDNEALEGYVSEFAHSGDAHGPRPDDGTLEAYATTLADFGQLLLVRGQVGRGIRVLEAARDAAPGAAHIHNNLGVAYREAGRLKAAREELAAAISLAPGRADTYHNLSRLDLAAGDVEAAIGALERAVRLDPGSVRYKMELAALLEREGGVERAETLLRWAERNAADDPAARLAYGDFLLRQERYTEAVAAFRRAEESGPSSAGVFTSLSRCYWEMDDLDAAVAAMRRSVELQPHNPRLKYDLAVMLARNGQPEEALEYLDDVVRLLPTAWQPLGLKATVLGGLGFHTEARRFFQRARELGGQGEQFLAAWSELELAAGDTAAAAEIMRGRR